MTTTEWILIGLSVLTLGLSVVVAWVAWQLKAQMNEGLDEKHDTMIDAILMGTREERKELQAQLMQVDRNSRESFTHLMAFVTDQQGKNAEEVKRLNEKANQSLNELNAILHKRLLEMQASVDERLQRLRDAQVIAQREQQDLLHVRLNEMRTELDKNLERIRVLNEGKLEAMRATVEEKLDKTLNERLTASFRTVDEKLGLVQSGLGEMRSMAASVRDLKGVLTNVKTRGTFGETQLSALLSDVLTAGQYETQFRLIPGSNATVDFAIRLPGQSGDQPCWLPIDAKFPVEDYERVLAANESGDRRAEEDARKALERAVLVQAKSIREKYIRPPYTTEFALMYFPSEGLYAEVLRQPGLFDKLQRDYRITPVGPTVVSALINSLQMGFVTLALQERSSEVWKVLADVKSEFIRFADGFAKVQKKFSEAQSSLEAMQTRQNVMQKTMASIDVMVPQMSGDDTGTVTEVSPHLPLESTGETPTAPERPQA